MIVSLLVACGTEPHPHKPHAEHAAHGEHREGHGDHGSAHHRFDDAEKWAKVFDDPERDAWQKPDLVVQALTLSKGMTVADIGAGTGYFNPHLAAAVGPEGTVIAIDVEDTLVAHMTQRAIDEATPWVKPRKAPFESPALQAGEADRVLIVDTYHHIEDRTAYFAKVKEGTAKGGRLLVVDLTASAPFGPPPEMRLSPDAVKAELAEAGWVFVASVDGLPHQYMLSFKAAEAP